MKKHWVTGVMMLVMSAGNLGCYYDQYLQQQSHNRTLQEKLAATQDDLQSAELMNRQKDTTIDGLNKQIEAKDGRIASLTEEVQGLREAQNKALGILEKQASKGPGDVVFVRQALPQPLHEKLKKLASEHPDIIEYDAAKGAVRWKADLLFPLGSDQLAGSKEALDALGQFAEIVKSDSASGFDVIIVGHTCTTPIMRAETLAEHKTNWHLSAHRAISVMNLLGKRGVAMARMGVMGYGEHRPIADNSSDKGKAKNRRVEIYLVPQESVQAVSQNIYRVDGLELAFARP